MPLIRHKQRAITAVTPAPNQGQWINPNKASAGNTNNFFIDPGGTDANDGLSAGNPVTSIARINEVIQPGGTVTYAKDSINVENINSFSGTINGNGAVVTGGRPLVNGVYNTMINRRWWMNTGATEGDWINSSGTNDAVGDNLIDEADVLIGDNCWGLDATSAASFMTYSTANSEDAMSGAATYQIRIIARRVSGAGELFLRVNNSGTDLGITNLQADKINWLVSGEVNTSADNAGSVVNDEWIELVWTFPADITATAGRDASLNRFILKPRVNTGSIWVMNGFWVTVAGKWVDTGTNDVWTYEDFTNQATLVQVKGLWKQTSLAYADYISGAEVVPKSVAATPAALAAGEWYSDGYRIYYHITGGETDPNDLAMHDAGILQQRSGGATWTSASGETVRFNNSAGVPNFHLRFGDVGLSMTDCVANGGGIDCDYSYQIGMFFAGTSMCSFLNGGTTVRHIIGDSRVTVGVSKGNGILTTGTGVTTFYGLDVSDCSDDGVQPSQQGSMHVEGAVIDGSGGISTDEVAVEVSLVSLSGPSFFTLRNAVIIMGATTTGACIHEETSVNDAPGITLIYENITTIQDGTAKAYISIGGNATYTFNKNYLSGSGINAEVADLTYQNNPAAAPNTVTANFLAGFRIDATSGLVGLGINTTEGIGVDGRPFADPPSVAGNEGAGV